MSTAVTFLIPVRALLLGMTILGKQLDARHFADMVLIGLELATIDGRPLAFARARFGPRRARAHRSTSSEPEGIVYA